MARTLKKGTKNMNTAPARLRLHHAQPRQQADQRPAAADEGNPVKFMLNTIAMNIGLLIGSGGLKRKDAEKTLTFAANATRLVPAAEVANIVRRALDMGEDAPGAAASPAAVVPNDAGATAELEGIRVRLPHAMGFTVMAEVSRNTTGDWRDEFGETLDLSLTPAQAKALGLTIYRADAEDLQTMRAAGFDLPADTSPLATTPIAPDSRLARLAALARQLGAVEREFKSLELIGQSETETAAAFDTIGWAITDALGDAARGDDAPPPVTATAAASDSKLARLTALAQQLGSIEREGLAVGDVDRRRFERAIGEASSALLEAISRAITGEPAAAA